MAKKIATSSAQTDDSKASRIFGLLPVSTISKNKIKILSPKSIYLLNNDSDKIDSIQKTSIVINNSDCSNVNVNGGNSSAVIIKNISNQHIENVKDEQMNKVQENSLPSVNSSNEISIVFHSKNQNMSKTLICLDYKDNYETLTHSKESPILIKDSEKNAKNPDEHKVSKPFVESLISKILNDPYLSHLLYGLEMGTITNVIESSFSRLCAGKFNLNTKTVKDSETEKMLLKHLHDVIKTERNKISETDTQLNVNIQSYTQQDTSEYSEFSSSNRSYHVKGNGNSTFDSNKLLYLRQNCDDKFSVLRF